MGTKLRLVLSTTILFFSFYGTAQTSYWKRDVTADRVVPPGLRASDYARAKTYSLAGDFFGEIQGISRQKKSRATILYFPDARGELVPFEVWEKPVLSAPLASKYPGIRSFAGRGLKDREARIRFSISHKGFQGMIIDGGGGKNTFMEKVAGTEDKYLLYQREELSDATADFICYTSSVLGKEASASALKLVDDQLLRTYRIAVSATGEYTQFHGGTVPDALAAINATLTRVNEVFETDLGISLELAANTDQVIFTDPTTDPYNSSLNTEVQNTLTDSIGEANYDVGHLFHKDNDSGNAGFIGSVCKDNQKGSAFSSAQIPQGDVFDLDFVAHEIGHQFGANHTWSFESEGTLVQAEPGSGSTIMGYAGIVDGNNVQPNGDDYFHYYSIFQITNYVQTVNCATTTSLSNNPPVVSSTGDFIIPKGTAFVLTANASDPDPQDVLTYTWEQVDDGVVTASSFGPTNATGANFRSVRPDISPSRYFPRLSEVVLGNLTQVNPAEGSAWETVSTVERDLNFALTVRDNAPGGGQVSSDLVNVRVLSNAGPFLVNSPAGGEAYPAGSIQTVSWEVAGTNLGPIRAQLVDIFLSTDGGQTFPILLAEAVPNDGSQEVLIPGMATVNARLMVKASDNVFFALNEAEFTIEESQVVLGFPQLEYTVCQSNELDIYFSYETFAGFAEEVSFSASGAPGALGITFTPATASMPTDSVNLNISNTDVIPPGIYPLTITATSASLSKQVELQLHVLDGTFDPPVLNSPADMSTNVSLNVLLQWGKDPAYSSYELEIATDPAFNNLVETAEVIFTNYKPAMLEQSTTYFWRVKPLNQCGEGVFTTPFSFSTIPVSCQEQTAADLPIPISSVGTPMIESTLNFLDDLPIADVNVDIALDHTFLGDLVITLISPQGTEVVLTSNSCGEFSNLNAVFDDDAQPFQCGNNPAIGGTVRPLGSLASLNGESAFGKWTLRVSDTAPADGGALTYFSLEICGEGTFRPDADGDGVFDDGPDLCLGTPAGAEVNPDGCEVFRFDPNNFTVALDSETCIPNDNGAIVITANEISDYTINVSGPGVNVTDTFGSQFELNNLAAGTYTLCIGGSNGVNEYEPYCFEANIQQPQPLSVSVAYRANGRQAVLSLGGAATYQVELNGSSRLVSSDEVVLDLKEGNNILKVSTGLACQGTFSETLFLGANPLFYPNPFAEELSVRVGDLQEVEVSVYNLSGILLERKVYRVDRGEVRLPFTGRPPGVYLIGLNARDISGTFKVVKE